MSAEDQLELFAHGLLSVRLDIVRNGQPLTRTGVLYDGLQTGFELAGVAWRTGSHLDGRTGWGLLRSIGKGCLGYRDIALRAGDAPAAAVARGRGVWHGGFDLELGELRAGLAYDKQRSCYVFSSAAGHGECVRLRDRRGHVIRLPASLPPALQVFVALLPALGWYRMENTH